MPLLLNLMLTGAGLGLLLAVPLGPIGVLCLRRSLASGMGAGLATGLGAATADAIYAGVAAFGLGVAAPLIAQAGWLRLLGGLALIGLGVRDLAGRPDAPEPPTLRGEARAYSGAVLLTLANPATILTFAAVIVGLDLVPDLASNAERSVFVAGVFLGSTLWWIVLAGVGSRIGTRLPPSANLWTRRLAGLVLAGFGLFAVAGAAG